MTIFIPRSLMFKNYMPDLSEAIRKINGTIIPRDTPYGAQSWALSWAIPVRDFMNAVCETGFFYEAMYLDSQGSYEDSSLNLPGAIESIRSYEPPWDIVSRLLAEEGPDSKYKQHGGDVVDWIDVVLPLQVYHDRSLTHGANSQTKYREFLVGACKHYGKHLLLKTHPMAPLDQRQDAEEIAAQYGARVAATNFSVLRYCRFVLVFNSGFAIDAMLRGVNVAQFAPGFWHKTGAVTYTDGKYPDDVGGTINMGYRFVNFLAHRYCFCWQQPGDQWVAMLQSAAKHHKDGDLFLLDPEFSYAENLHHRSKEWLSMLQPK